VLRCWGSSLAGELGYGNTDTIGDDEIPSSVAPVNVGPAVDSIAAGNAFTCALLDTQSIRCWGTNARGELGVGNTESIGDDEVPFAGVDVRLGADAIAITSGTSHSCALTSLGTVRCWGVGEHGRLGYGNCEVFPEECDIGNNEWPSTEGDVPVE
jgi:alpha-tubulin suppressor-like RCC1 family protein